MRIDLIVNYSSMRNKHGDKSLSHYQENLDTLRGLLPAPFLGEIPFINNPLAADLQGCLDISPLL